MAYTLADMKRSSQDIIKKGVIDVFRKDSPIMDAMTFETSSTLAVKLMRTKTMPSVVTRNIGEAYTESKAVLESVEESVALLGGYIDIPKELLKDKSTLIDQRAMQTKQFVRSMAYKWNDMFINGDPSSDPKGIAGLAYRVANDVTSQYVVAAASTGLDVSADASTLSTQQGQLMDKIDELIHMCDGHQADYLLMNDTMYMRLVSALRGAGMWATTKDLFGVDVATWGPGGPKIVDVGYKADQSTRIITNTETFAGLLTGGGQTSIYAVKFGDEYLKCFQFQPLEVTDVGLLESGVSVRTIIDWGVGLYFANPRSFARLYGLIAA